MLQFNNNRHGEEFCARYSESRGSFSCVRVKYLCRNAYKHILTGESVVTTVFRAMFYYILNSVFGAANSYMNKLSLLYARHKIRRFLLRVSRVRSTKKKKIILNNLTRFQSLIF